MARTTAQPAQAQTENLALLFQEVLTAIVRLRSNRQPVAEAGSFRQQIVDALRIAAQEARSRGSYAPEDIKLATFAVVGFLDESVLNSQNPLFSEWPRKPLQEELFGTHMAGEVFFQNLRGLLERMDSEQTADVLEVYQLCLLLGFRGRYSAGGRGDLNAMSQAAGEKIRRIRGDRGPLAPQWSMPAEKVSAPRDFWIRPLMISAAAAMVVAIALFILFSMSLSSGASAVAAIASGKA